MERLRRIATVWSWLPAFRAVAETEHLPTASAELHVSASALSRTIRLLEQDLGLPLFVRLGRRIELNDAGVRLLAAVRDAMRLVHDGLQSLRASPLDGPLLLATTTPMLESMVLRGALELRVAQPDTHIEVLVCAADELIPRLLRGQVDVVFALRPFSDPAIARVAVGELRRAVYIAAGHPLAHRSAVTHAELGTHPWVAVSGVGEDDANDDGWPSEVPRNTLANVGSTGAAVQACLDFGFAAVLPVDLGRSVAQLHEVPGSIIAPASVFAHHRETLATRDHVTALVGMVRALENQPNSGQR